MNDNVRTFDIHEHKLDFHFNYNMVETSALHELLNNDDAVTLDKLRRASLWKLNRILHIPEITINKLQQLAVKENLCIEDAEVEEIINDLMDCPGVGMPMASTFLKFLRPDIFPITDVRAYRALFGKKINSYSYNIYRDYVKRIYEISDIKGLNLSAIDEQLYCFDKEHNGKI
jgi:hypothetical protein